MKVINELHLEYVHGSSNKFYTLVLLENADGTFSTAFNYGPRGRPRSWDFKVKSTDHTRAQSEFDKIATEKRAKGYQDVPWPIPSIYHYPGAARPGQAGSVPAPSPAPVQAPRPVSPAAAVPVFPAQLAGETKGVNRALAQPGRYAVEQKYDGVRALITFLPDKTIVIRNRYGENKGRLSNTPRLEAALRELAEWVPGLWQGSVIDGELVGKTWNETMHLLGGAGRNESGLRFVSFDLPYLAGEDLRSLTWTERRTRLELVARHFAEPIELVGLLQPTVDLAELIWQAGGEGLIVKDRTASYRPGDRSAWGKIKKVVTTEAVIMGFASTDSRNASTFGALEVGQYRHGKLVKICALAGMSDQERKSLASPKMIGSVVEFKHHGQTESSYRDPRYVRARPDKKAEDCVWPG